MRPASSQDPFISQLAELCATAPTRAKWVFVSTHAIGRMLGDRLVLEGRDWANLRFVTPLDIATRMGAPFLVERGIDPSEEGLGPALIMRLLLGLPEQPSYFRPLASHPAMAQALWSTIRELRMAGVSPSDLVAEAFSSAAKQTEIQALYSAYESFLSANARGDMATVYSEALLHPDWCPIQAHDCWTEMSAAAWTPLQRRLLDALPGERIAPRSFELPGAAIPRRLAQTPVDLVVPDAASPLAFLQSPGAAAGNPEGLPPHEVAKPEGLPPHELAKPKGLPPHEVAKPKDLPPPLRVDLFHAGGREAEVEEVFRRVLHAGCPLDHVEVACASDDYTVLLWEKACRYEWPVTLATGLPASLTRPGRALVGLDAWIESDFAAGDLRRLLQSGDVTLGNDELSPGQAARVLVKAEAAWGRKTYDLSLGKLSSRYRLRGADTELPDDQRTAATRKAEQADNLLTWVRTLLRSIPEGDADGLIELQDLVDGISDFIESYAAKSSALDGAAALALASAIAELKALGSFKCTLMAGLRFINERVDGLRVGAHRAQSGHLHVSALAQAGFPGRPHVFIVGLEEGRVFPSAIEDPVLLDVERSRISPLLRLSSDRSEEAVYAVLNRLAATSGSESITLSYSSRDLREFRQTYPSWLMLQAHRIVSGKPESSFPDLLTALGTPVSCVPATEASALGEAGWWLHGLKQAGGPGRAAVLEQYASLQHGLHAETQRDSMTFTEFDGWVPDAGAYLDPCKREAPVSATQLERAAGCPFRHFLERGLGLVAVDDGGRDSDVWLDPMTRGSLLHALYARLMRRSRDEKRRLSVTSDMAFSEAIAREALEALRAEMPPPSQEVFDREYQDFMNDVVLFVRAEDAADASRTAIGFEVSFGRPGSEEGEPLARKEPIVIDLGGGLKFRLAGQIDRIDQIDDDCFEVIDYKTGGYWEGDWAGITSGGRKLQHALYGLAAAEILKQRVKNPKVTRGTYYFTSAKGGQERRTIDAMSTAKLTAVLSDLRQVIASGLFVHSPDESACKWCDFGNACGTEVQARAKCKTDSDAGLEFYRKLAAHE